MQENIEYIEHKFIKPRSVQKRLYQELLTAKAIDDSTLVVAPTGLGKTIVAVLLIAHTYSFKKNILFLAPTKPLVVQHKRSLDKLLNIEEENIILLTGQVPKNKRKEIYKNLGRIICATPQTINNDIKFKLINFNDFNLIIFDEAHRAIGDYAYVNISSFFPREIKRLALTASPGGNRQKIEEVANNLKVNHIEIRTEDDLDVVDFVKGVDIETIFTELDNTSKQISKIFTEFIEKKISFLRKLNLKIPSNYTKKQMLMVQAQIFERLKKNKNNILFLGIANITLILKVYHAKELIETQGFLPLKNYIDNLFLESKLPKAKLTLKNFVNSKEILEVYKLLLNNKEVYSKDKLLLNILENYIKDNPKSRILIFNNFRDTANHLVSILNKNKLIKSTRFVGQATRSQADKGLSQKEQIEIISDFKKGVFNALVCTSVGEEGLDIPSVDLVIFYDAVASEIRAIQRRGRTGRFSVGKVILLLNKDTIDEHYYWVSINKEKKMKSVLKNYHTYKPRKKKSQSTLNDFFK
ncbi:MAG: helicase-related protein [archaeon]|jgi:Fanconi anemia group M protein|nr:DEAD/DEAH box helicase family protein [archaeon]MDD2477561.1 helicase-related protein [Candidatus ainarchaeum sp.]MDD3084343.1 helicase-related protein [Candidatus ainarchaeum sp.]MDD4221085.1 helicase-related protein [Candidatus ainarchaeum sp.]MDD4662556.1 helicase-related protein [Candidatus ainarchaeum sp.]